jgi:cytochrome c553
MTRFLSIFSIGLILGLALTIGIGKMAFSTNTSVSAAKSGQSTIKDIPKEKSEKVKGQDNMTKTASNPEAQIFVKSTCITCHSMSKYGLEGGKQGPDLTNPMMGTVIEEKYGISLRDYLDNPKSQVMSGVLSNLKLTDEVKDKISKLLTEK